MPCAKCRCASGSASRPCGAPDVLHSVVVELPIRGGAPDAVTSLPARDARASAVDDPHRAVSVWQAPGRRGLSDPQLVELYRKHGRRTPHDVPGAFAFVLYDPAAGVVLAARDAVGTRPLYYQRIRGAVRVACSLAPFADREILAAEVDSRWLAAYLEGLAPAEGHTAFDGVQELLPGQMLWGEDGHLHTTRWHGFSAPPSAVSDPNAAIEAYHQAVRNAARTDGRPAAVELGITLAANVLLAAATGEGASRDDGLWGVGFANFDRSRDAILEAARRDRLAGADVISGWPGRGTTWRHWYRSGAGAVGQPVYHTDLMFQALLDCMDGIGRSLLLAGGNDWAFGWEFRPPLASRRDATMFHRAARAVRGVGSSLRGVRTPRRQASPSGRWQPGPFISPAVAADLGLAQLARAHWQTAAEPPVTGYAAWTEHGLVQGQRERLSTWYLLGQAMGINVEFPLFDPAVVAALLALPRELNDLQGMPGAAALSLLASRVNEVDWRARRWPGQERSKTPDEVAANGAARRAYLRENLHPRLEALLNMDVLGPRLAAQEPAGVNEVYEGQRRRQSSVEFAHIEAANYWLESWSIP